MNNRPSLDEFFPQLAAIESAPLELCKAAYDRLDASSPGNQMPHLYELAGELKTTRAVLERLYPGMDLDRYKPEHFQTFMLCVEYSVRLVNGTATPTN